MRRIEGQKALPARVAFVSADVASAQSQTRTNVAPWPHVGATLVAQPPPVPQSAVRIAIAALLLVLVWGLSADGETHAYLMRDTTHFVVPTPPANTTPIAADLSIAL